jgi:hypothetical protein
MVDNAQSKDTEGFSNSELAEDGTSASVPKASVAVFVLFDGLRT